MLKKMIDEMAEGKTLKVSCQCQDAEKETTAYVKMDRNRCNVLYRKKRSDSWDLIESHPEICAALMRSNSSYSVVNEYTHAVSKAFNAMFITGATIASECSEASGNPGKFTYHLDPGGMAVDSTGNIAALSYKEYTSKWKIDYPKEEEE